MELKTYLRIMIAKWRIVVPVFLITLIATTVLTFAQQSTYQSVATYVVKPRVSADLSAGAAVNALSILGSPEIAGTFVEVANSRLITTQSVAKFGLSREQASQMSVSARKVPGTNVIEITVRGPNPVLVRDFASTVGTKATEYILGLYQPYELQSVDEPLLPESPVRPNKALNLLLGTLAGLLLSAGMAFTSFTLRPDSVNGLATGTTAVGVSE